MICSEAPQALFNVGCLEVLNLDKGILYFCFVLGSANFVADLVAQ